MAVEHVACCTVGDRTCCICLRSFGCSTQFRSFSFGPVGVGFMLLMFPILPLFSVRVLSRGPLSLFILAKSIDMLRYVLKSSPVPPNQ